MSIWGVSVWVEFMIMVHVALFFALVLSSAVTATLMGFAFYVLARLMGNILGIIAAEGESGINLLMEKVMLVISVIIPRLDLMGQSTWLLYSAENTIDWSFIALQGFVFCGLVFSAALLDLNRRQF